MKNIKRTIALVIAGIMLLTLLGGCAKKTGGDPTGEPEQTEEGQPASETTEPAPAGEVRKTEPEALKPFTAAAAEYPAQVQYPANGDFSGQDALDAWFASQRARSQYRGAGEGLAAYIQKTVPVFLRGDDGENRVFSPMNLYFALAMLAEVTDGDSRKQALDLLDAESLEALRRESRRLWLANYCDDGASANVLADSLWLRDDMDYTQDTLNNLAKYYYASAYRGTMGDPAYDAALQTWINDRTGNLLEGMTGSLKMSPETVLSIVSTLYFKDKWDYEFSEKENTDETFHGAKGDTEATFMHRTQFYGPYYYGDGFSAAEIRLNKEGSMLFLLPDEGLTPEEMLAKPEALRFLSTRDKDADWSGRSRVRVQMSVPKFDVSAQTTLDEGLRELGLTDCYDQTKADFSPLTAQAENLFLSQVLQGARVAIDEQGVTAAAYTVMMTAGAAEPPEEEVRFTLDRPFAFVINNMDNLPLFVGVVNQVK